MRKTSFTIVAIATALTLASCQEDSPGTGLSAAGFRPMTISALAEGIGASTKVAMEYSYDVLWNPGDKILVSDGSTSDTFTLSQGEGTSKGTFVQDHEVSLKDEVEAFYPSAISQSCGLVWPAVQQGDVQPPMYCKKTLDGSDPEEFSFSSLGTVLQIVFNTSQYGVVLKSIEIRDGENTMSGAFKVDENGQAVITATDHSGVTLDLGEGVEIGKSSKFFHLAVPAGEYKDLTLTFTAADGRECVMRSESLPALERNTVCRIALSGEFTFTHIPEGALIGEFTVNAKGDKIRFSRGNLQAVYNGKGYNWRIARNQYDFVGNGAGNTELGYMRAGYVLDLFGWSTSAEGNNFGINGSEFESEYAGNFVDWGKKAGDGSTWHTLSLDEWKYILEKRDGDNNKLARGVSVCGFPNCLILAPDGYKGTIEKSYDMESWTLAENRGLVCLPAVGYRRGFSVNADMVNGYYWTSSPSFENASYLYFESGKAYVASQRRCFGCSVRLVTSVSSATQAE